MSSDIPDADQRMSSAPSLHGKVALVTGAAGGLGRVICETLMARGASVLRVDLAGDNCLHEDIGTTIGNRNAIAGALDQFGRLDILVLNAGLQFMAPLSEFPEAEWDRLMNVMVKGPFLAIKYAWDELISRPGARIIATASGLSMTAEEYKAAYVAAKHALLGLIRVAALEGGPHGLTANAVAPGWMHTALVEGQVTDQMRLRGLSREATIEHMVGRQPVKRFLEPAEIANVVAFLASEAASGINGACIPIDLGALVA